MSVCPAQPASGFVNEDRLSRRLTAMAAIGATAQGGVNRQALTREDALAQRLLIEWGAELGLSPCTDPAGNLFLRLPGLDADAAPVLSGSHLDSQPTGGKLDGVYGVLAALEAVQAIVATGVTPHRPIEIVAWMNEEGSRYAPGMMGSAAFTGARPLPAILAVTDAAGISVAQALADVRRLLPEIPQRKLGLPVAAYVEAHIEQGPELEQHGDTIGVVTGIQGKRTFRVQVLGAAAHAGTSRRAERKDAMLAATGMIQALAHALHDPEDIVKFTVGRYLASPNAPSVVASEVVFSIDLRHPDSTRLKALGDQIAPICQASAAPCDVHVEELSRADSLEFPPAMRDRVRRAAARLGLRHRDILSTAGHDARYLHPHSPSAMIFVPSHLGLTHCETEYTAPADLAAGARVLVDVLTELANR